MTREEFMKLQPGAVVKLSLRREDFSVEDSYWIVMSPIEDTEAKVMNMLSGVVTHSERFVVGTAHEI